jgi:hypothetical protein
MSKQKQEICHICGERHPMALTPFPLENGWPCPYDATPEAYIERVGMINPDAAARMRKDKDE